MKTNFGNNLRKLRKKLNLSVKGYSELTGLSPATIVNIEQGHSGLKIETMKQLISFTGFSVEDFNSESFIIPSDFQHQMFLRHEDDIELREYFVSRPKIRDAINDELLNDEFLSYPQEIHEIVKYFNKKGIEIRGTSLQNELKKHPDIRVSSHPTKKGTNVYFRKRLITNIN